MDRSVPRVLPCPKSRGAVADSRALAGLFLFPRRWGRQPSGPEPYHLLCTLRQHGRRLALCFCGRSATSRPHYSIGSAQPHTHQRVFLDPGISHVLWRVKTTLGKQAGKTSSTSTTEAENYLYITYLHFLHWRRGWDSNPRYVAVYLISSQAPSTTRPTLR